MISAMEEVFIGGGASIRDGRKRLSLWEVAKKVEQTSQRREVSSSDATTNPRITHGVVTLRSFDNLFKKIAKSSSSRVKNKQSDDVTRASSILAIFAGGTTDDPQRPKKQRLKKGLLQE